MPKTNLKTFLFCSTISIGFISLKKNHKEIHLENLEGYKMGQFNGFVCSKRFRTRISRLYGMIIKKAIS